jgi:hypothetical protein
MDELNIKHQLCIFHFKKEINTKIKKIKRKKQVLKEDLDKINRYKDLIFQIVDSKTYNNSKKNCIKNYYLKLMKFQCFLEKLS